MAKIKFVVQRSGSYGAKGDVVALELPKEGLTDRQKVLLKPYTAPVVKGDDDESELDKLKAQVTELTKESAELKADLELSQDEVKELTLKLAEATKPKK